VSGRGRAAAVLLAAGVLVVAPPAARGAELRPETLAALQLAAHAADGRARLRAAGPQRGEMSLASQRGRVVLLISGDVVSLLREGVARVHQAAGGAYADRSLTVLAVNIERPETVRSWVRQHKGDGAVLLDADGEVSADYRVTATPPRSWWTATAASLARAVGTRPWTAEQARPLWDALLGAR
jgi:hypothetical protein